MTVVRTDDNARQTNLEVFTSKSKAAEVVRMREWTTITPPAGAAWSLKGANGTQGSNPHSHHKRGSRGRYVPHSKVGKATGKATGNKRQAIGTQ